MDMQNIPIIPSMVGDDRRLKLFHHQNLQPLKCPRCDSLDTKFCYYNNYNYSQPRHFCKTCRRYWTIGGVLRNVPIGGGGSRNRKSKNSKVKHPISIPVRHLEINSRILGNSPSSPTDRDNNATVVAENASQLFTWNPAITDAETGTSTMRASDFGTPLEITNFMKYEKHPIVFSYIHHGHESMPVIFNQESQYCNLIRNGGEVGKLQASKLVEKISCDGEGSRTQHKTADRDPEGNFEFELSRGVGYEESFGWRSSENQQGLPDDDDIHGAADQISRFKCWGFTTPF